MSPAHVLVVGDSNALALQGHMGDEARVRVVDLGMCTKGATSEEVLRTVQSRKHRMRAAWPDAAVLFVGANDGALPACMTAHHVQETVRRLHAVVRTVLVVPPFDVPEVHGGGGEAASRHRRQRACYVTACADSSLAPAGRVQDVVRVHMDPQTHTVPDHMRAGDALHLSEYGYRAVAAVVAVRCAGEPTVQGRLVAHFVAAIARTHGRDLSGDWHAMCRLRSACESMRGRLASEGTAASVTVRVDALFEGVDMDLSMTRAGLEEDALGADAALVGCGVRLSAAAPACAPEEEALAPLTVAEAAEAAEVRKEPPASTTTAASAAAAAPPRLLPDGWTEEVRPKGRGRVRTYTVYHGPNGAYAESRKQAWEGGKGGTP